MQYGDYFTADTFESLSDDERIALYNAFKFIGLPMSDGVSDFLKYDEEWYRSTLDEIFVYNQYEHKLWVHYAIDDLATGKCYTKQDLLNLIELACVGN